MIPLAKHTAQILTLAGVPLFDPVSVRVEMDESWSPRVQAAVTLHRDQAEALPERVLVRLRAAFGSDMSIAAITAWAGGSMAALTARVGGSVAAMTALHTRPWNPFESTLPLSHLPGSMAALTTAYQGDIAKITAALRQPGGAYLPPAPQILEYVLHRRTGEDARRDDLTTVQLASAEIALHDYRRTQTTPYTSTQTSLRSLVAYVLDLVSGTLNAGADLAVAAGAIWEPGQTAWEFLQPVIEAAGWQLYADEHGRYTLAPRVVVPATVDLDFERNLIDWHETTEPAHDSVIVEYTGTDPHTYDVYAPTGSRRPLHETRDSNKSASGAASEIALRAEQRARGARAEAVSLYGLRPLDRLPAQLDDTTTKSGTVESVAWEWPQSTMLASLRDLTTV